MGLFLTGVSQLRIKNSGTPSDLTKLGVGTLIPLFWAGGGLFGSDFGPGSSLLAPA